MKIFKPLMCLITTLASSEALWCLYCTSHLGGEINKACEGGHLSTSLPCDSNARGCLVEWAESDDGYIMRRRCCNSNGIHKCKDGRKDKGWEVESSKSCYTDNCNTMDPRISSSVNSKNNSKDNSKINSKNNIKDNSKNNIKDNSKNNSQNSSNGDILDYCLYNGEILPVGERLPLAENCFWLVCNYSLINNTHVPNLDVEVNHPGCGCCIGEDGAMYQEGANITLASGLEVSCCKGNWVQVVQEPSYNLVVTGGSDGDGNGGELLKTSEVITPDGLCNHSIPRLPLALTRARSAYLDNYLLICGGNSYGAKTLDSCYKLENSGFSWIKAASLKHPRYDFTLTKVGHELVVLGGTKYGFSGDHDSIEKFSAGSWQLLTQTMTSTRESHCTVHLKTKNSLVVTGGTYTNKVELLELTSLMWTTLAPLPLRDLAKHACTTRMENDEEMIYVSGGWSEGSGRWGPERKVWKFDGAKWLKVGELVQPRNGHSMAFLAGKLMVLGGFGPFTPESRRDGCLKSRCAWLDSIEVMVEGNSTQWSTGLSEIRSNHAMAVVPAEAFPCQP